MKKDENGKLCWNFVQVTSGHTEGEGIKYNQ